MTVSTTNAFSGPFFPNGATTVFPFTFTAPSVDEVSVISRDSDGNDTTVSPSLYTVTLNADGGGSITYATAPATGPTLYVLLDPEFTQDIAFEDGSGWLAAPVNEGYDRSASRDQALKRDLDRSLKVPLDETGLTLPAVSVRAGYFFAFDAGGAPTIATGTGADGSLRPDVASTATGKGAALVGYRYGTIKDKLDRIWVTPEDYRQPGYTDTQACLAWAAALGNGVCGRILQDYVVTQAIFVLDKSYFIIDGTGSIKVADGTVVDYGYAALWIGRCTDFLVEGIRLDGNRANRVPAEKDAHTLTITECHRFTVRRVTSNNAVCDGFMIRTDTNADTSTHPSDWVIEDCSADNCYRQGMTVAEARRFVVRRFRGTNTNGTAPEAAIDAESLTTDPANSIQDGLFEDCYSEGNNGHGCLVAGLVQPKNIQIVRWHSKNDAKGAIVANFKNGVIDTPLIEGYADNAAADALGAIYVAPSADYGGLVIRNPKFRSCTNVNNPLFNINADNVVISGLDVDSCGTVAALYGARCRLIDSIYIGPNLFTSNGAISVFGADCVVSRNWIANFNNEVIYADAARFVCEGNTITTAVNFPAGTAGAIRVVQAGARVNFNRITRGGSSVAANAIYFDAAAAEVVNNSTSGMTGTPIYFGAAPTLKRGNVADGTLLSETAIAP